jgi:hypothetical protein
MSGDGACHGDMPTFPRLVTGGIPPAGDPAFDALLDSALAPEDAPAGLRPLAEAFDALAATPAHGGPGAEASALRAFRGAVAGTAQPAHRRPRRRPVLTSLLSAKVAAAATVAALAVGGTAAAAFADKLPARAQKFAHDTIGAPMTPAPQPEHSAVLRPVSSPLPGNSASGLCTAWEHMQASGTAAQKATAFRRLEAVAGGASRVSSFCAGARHPFAKPTAIPSPTPAPRHPGQRAVIPRHTPGWRGPGKPTGTP